MIEQLPQLVAREVGILLELDPIRMRAAGQSIYCSPNGVILARHVPAHSIVALHPLTRRAQKSIESLREMLRAVR